MYKEWQRRHHGSTYPAPTCVPILTVSPPHIAPRPARHSMLGVRKTAVRALVRAFDLRFRAGEIMCRPTAEPTESALDHTVRRELSRRIAICRRDHALRHPELKVSTPAHTEHPGWCVDSGSRGMPGRSLAGMSPAEWRSSAAVDCWCGLSLGQICLDKGRRF